MALTVAGFSGLPVKGGVGIKPLVVCDASPGAPRFALAGSGDESWHSEEEMSDFEARGLVTLVGLKGPFREGDVAVYAHLDFLAPSGGTGRLPLSVDQRFTLYAKPESFIAVLSLDEATTQMKAWAGQLLQQSRRVLQLHTVPRVDRGALLYDEAMRARFALAGTSDEKARSMRLDAFAAAWAGLHLQGADASAFETDALLNFGPGEVQWHALQKWYDAAAPTRLARVDSGAAHGPHLRWLEVA